MKLGFLGCGSIASAVATGLAGKGHQITVSRRSAKRSEGLASRFAEITIADNQDVLDNSDVVFLGTTAEQAPEVLKSLSFRPDHRVISFMVGLAPQDIRALIQPAHFDCVMIPFPSIAEGGSPVLTHPQSPTVETLLAQDNTVLAVPTSEALNDFLAAQAVLSPVVQMLATATDWLADRTGAPGEAEDFLRLLVGGSILARPMGETEVLRNLIAALNTPGGLNRELREHLEANGAFDATRTGLDQLAQRLAEA